MENYNNIKVGDKFRSLTSSFKGRKKDEIITIILISLNDFMYSCIKSPTGVYVGKSFFLNTTVPYNQNISNYKIY